MSFLVLVRHGESEWNQKGLWTGLSDISLTEKGKKQSRTAASFLKDIKFDASFTSKLKRGKETLLEIKKTLNADFPIFEDKALNERDYGEFTGKNKWEIKKQIGKEKFLKIRRGWDYPIAGGETLKDVYQRVIPFYLENILPRLKMGQNILISGHGNSLRALIKYLEGINDEQISNLELVFGGVYIYQINKQGNIVSKDIKTPNYE